MTTVVHAENFRGFKKIEFPIRSMSFLVGDNSSGKSSVLRLLNYVMNSALLETPTLQSDLHVDAYDFFSPYFDYAPVTIGYSWEQEGVEATRVVTLKERKGRSPKIDRLTVTANGMAMTLKGVAPRVFAKITSKDGQWTYDEALEHHRSTTGYRHIDVELYGEAINTHMVMDMCVKHLLNDRNEDLHRAVFGAPFEAARHIGPIRGEPERFYNFSRSIKSGGSHFASMWRDLQRVPGKPLREMIVKFGKESGLFDDFLVTPLSRLLDDSPMIVLVERNGKNFLINQVGAGVSQVLPVLVEIIFSIAVQDNTDAFLIQQPELHLHPVAQAAVGDFLFEASSTNLFFVVETHSDFCIDRYRSQIRDSEATTEASIIFCEGTPGGNVMTEIKIAQDGSLQDPPKSYHAFFLNELQRTIF